jgi:hypothetical protein
MAHSGRVYPVHFRRDWNLDVFNNNRGYGRGYVWSCDGGFGTIGIAMHGLGFNLVAVNEDSADQPIWESAVQTVAGRKIGIVQSLVYNGTLKRVEHSAQVTDSIVGSLAIYRGIVAAGLSFNQLQMNLDNASVTHPLIFLPTQSSSARSVVMNWAKWNSL